MMRQRDTRRGAGDRLTLTLGQRLAIVAVVMALVITACWVLAALLDSSTGPSADSGSPAGSGSRAETVSPAPEQAASGQPDHSGGEGVPEIFEPVAFAEAFTEVLWSYDTRTSSRAERTAQLRAWMSPEEAYADWDSVASQLPTPAAWQGLAGNRQRATAAIDGGRFPHAFTEALADDPGLITEAYIYAVTVTGRQSLAWAEGRLGEERRAVTLAVQCRPSTPCALSGVLPGVAP